MAGCTNDVYPIRSLQHHADVHVRVGRAHHATRVCRQRSVLGARRTTALFDKLVVECTIFEQLHTFERYGNGSVRA
jgi:hypothetical protein